MCEALSATTLAYISVGASVASAGVSMYGMAQQGAAAKAQGQYQAAVMRNNQILAQRAADDARDRGKEAEAQQRLKTRQLIGRQNAVLAGNGVLVNQDSALDITSDTAEQGEWEALTIRSNAEREALGFEAQGMNFQAQGTLAQMSGDNAYNASRIGMGATALGTIGTVAGRWYDFKRTGAFGGGGGGGGYTGPIYGGDTTGVFQ